MKNKYSITYSRLDQGSGEYIYIGNIYDGNEYDQVRKVWRDLVEELSQSEGWIEATNGGKDSKIYKFIKNASRGSKKETIDFFSV